MASLSHSRFVGRRRSCHITRNRGARQFSKPQARVEPGFPCRSCNHQCWSNSGGKPDIAEKRLVSSRMPVWPDTLPQRV